MFFYDLYEFDGAKYQLHTFFGKDKLKLMSIYVYFNIKKLK